MSDIGLKSIYLPFKIPFCNFSVFMMDIGTFQRAVKAFRVFFPSAIIHWSFTVHKGSILAEVTPLLAQGSLQINWISIA